MSIARIKCCVMLKTPHMPWAPLETLYIELCCCLHNIAKRVYLNALFIIFKGVTNHPSCLAKKHVLWKVDSALNSSIKSCSRAQQGKFTSGAHCHFLRCPLFIQRPVFTLYLLFEVKQQIACYWSVDNSMQRLDQMCSLPRGAAKIKSGVWMICASCH